MNDTGQPGQAEELFDDFPAPTKDQWKQQVEHDLKGSDYGRLIWKTYEGFSIEPMYTRDEVPDREYRSSYPGFYPYVRGVRALGHAGRPWVIAQMTCPPRPEAAAEEIVQARRSGQDGAALRLDRAAILASGTAEAEKHAGYSGTSVQHMTDFLGISERLQQDIPLEIHAGMSSPVYLAMAAAAERTLGELPFSVDTTFRLLHDAVSYVDHRELPTSVISICGECYHDAGANAVQEVACMMASGVEYLNRLTDMGLTPDAVARRVRFNIPVGMNFFMEIAKLRAARMLWARITTEFGVREEDARKMRAHVRTSRWHQTKYDPYVNMLRATIEAMAGVIGGTDSMYTAPFDEVAGTPGAFSKRIARNLQIILREEAKLAQVTDPAAGSYYIETLTAEIAEHGWALFREIEALGGYLAAAEQGFIQDRIEQTAAEKRANISSRRDVIVGSNQYPNLGEKPLTNGGEAAVDAREHLAASLRRHRESRTADSSALVASLRNMLQDGSGNLIASMAAGLQDGLTVAEVNDVLRNGGEGALRLRPLRPFRAAEQFETLRDTVGSSDRSARVFLATYGPGFWRRARATFSSGFFGTAGMSVIDNPGFDTPEEAAQAAVDAGADVVVACSDDESYADMVPRLIRVLRAAGSSAPVVVAGNPKEQLDALRENGVEWFIHVKTDAGAVLSEMLQRLGIAPDAGSEVKK